MEKQSNRFQLIEWLKEIVPYNNLEKYVREEREPDPIRFGFIACTGFHWFSIYGRETVNDDGGHIGCIAHCRITRPGENWLRGSDLPDGPFSRKTWESIKDAILRYVVVKLDPVHVSMGIREGQSEPVADLAPFRQDVFYGPHPCDDCGKFVVRQELLRGGVKFDSLGLTSEEYPSNRPDLPWKPHHCEPPKFTLPPLVPSDCPVATA